MIFFLVYCLRVLREPLGRRADIYRKSTQSIELNKPLDPKNELEATTLDKQSLEPSQSVSISLSSLNEAECSKCCRLKNENRN